MDDDVILFLVDDAQQLLTAKAASFCEFEPQPVADAPTDITGLATVGPEIFFGSGQLSGLVRLTLDEGDSTRVLDGHDPLGFAASAAGTLVLTVRNGRGGQDLLVQDVEDLQGGLDHVFTADASLLSVTWLSAHELAVLGQWPEGREIRVVDTRREAVSGDWSPVSSAIEVFASEARRLVATTPAAQSDVGSTIYSADGIELFSFGDERWRLLDWSSSGTKALVGRDSTIGVVQIDDDGVAGPVQVVGTYSGGSPVYGAAWLEGVRRSSPGPG